jgi:uncharacterized protein
LYVGVAALTGTMALGALTACTSGSKVVRGDAIDKAALDDFKCTADSLKGKSSPFLVSWPSAAREDIELAMHEGIVVVNYSCEGVKVLDACEVPGEYTYQGMETKKKVKRIEDSGEAAATFGGTFAVPSKVSASMSQGRTLNLAYSIVGARSTTVKSVTRDMLMGPECEGATHFVFRTKVGAFAMDTSEQGEASAAASAFGYGEAGGSQSSSNAEITQEGKVEACNDATADDNSSVSGCGAALRVSLVPIRPAKKKGAKKAPVAAEPEDEKGCPEGFVYVDDGCARPSKKVVGVCGWDAKECKANCSAGSSESCGRFSEILLSKHWEDFGGGTTGDAIGEMKPLIDGMNKHLKAACDDEAEGAACTLYAFTQSFGPKSSEDSSYYGPNGDRKETVPAFVKYAERGCGLANAMGCVAMATAYTDGYFADAEEYGEFIVAKDDAKAEKLLNAACNRGAARSCALLVTRNNGNRDNAIFKAKVMTNLSKACDGGQELACFTAGVVLLGKDQCTTLMSTKSVDARFEGDPIMSGEFTSVADPADAEDVSSTIDFVQARGCGRIDADPAAAARFLERACDADLNLDSNILCETWEAQAGN